MKYDIYSLYESCNTKEKNFIKRLGDFYGAALNKNVLYQVATENSLSYAMMNKLFEKLYTVSFLRYKATDGRFTISETGCIFALIKQVEEKEGKPVTVVQEVANDRPILYVREGIAQFLSTGKVPEFKEELILCEITAMLLAKTLYFDKLRGMQYAVPASAFVMEFSIIIDQFMKYLLPTGYIYDWYERTIHHPDLEEDDRSFLNRYILLADFVHGKDIEKITQILNPDTNIGKLINAYLYHLKGDVHTAISLYETVIKSTDGKLMPGLPLFDYSYTLALMQDESPGSKKKIASISRKKELKNSQYIIPYLLLVVCNETDKKKVEKILDSYIYVSQLSFYLANGICSYFNLVPPPTCTSAILSSSLDLLKLEFASFAPEDKEVYQEMKKKIGYDSLISRIPQTEEWEKVFNVIKQSTGKSVTPNATVQEQSRLVYHLFPENMHMTVVLQKSKDGVTWTKGRNVSLERFSKGNMPEMNDTDRQVSRYVLKEMSAYYYNSVSYSIDTPKALAELVGYPWVFLSTNPNIPIEIVKGMAEMTLDKTKTGFTMSFNIQTDSVSGLIKLVRETDTRIKVVQLTKKQLQIIQLLASIQRLPKHAEPKLMELLTDLKDVITIHSSLINTNTSLKSIKGDSLITVQLIPVGNTLKAELFVKPLITDPPYCKAGKGTKSILGNKEGEQVQVMRDLKKEKENYTVMSGLLQEISGDEDVEDTFTFNDPYDCLELLDALRQYNEYCIVEWPEGARFRISHSADIDNLSLSLKKKSNWFQMEGELKLDDNTLITIKDLLGKIRSSKGRFIQLNDTEFLALSNRLRKQLTELSAVTTEDKKKLHVQQFATLVFDKWAAQGTTIKGDKNYRELKERIEQTADKTYDVPKQLNAELRDYQLTGFTWLARLYDWKAGACLADDMGLGKTIQSIAMLLHKAKEGPSLVISPASVLLNWENEICKFGPSLNVLVFNNAENRKKLLEQAEGYDVVLATYGLLVTEEKLLTGMKWNMIILDEAHTIKNRDTKTSKSAMKLDADFRIILTGTPIQNHLGEIWNLFQFINPGLLSSLEVFTERFITPITQYQDKEAQKRLKKIISPFILRRTKSEVLEELPQRTEIIKEIELSEAEMGFYEVLRRETENSLATGATSPLQALSEITRLRQAACNTALVNNKIKIKSSKEETFLHIVDELITNNHRALVFSQFTSHLALIKQALDKMQIEYLYLDGSTPIQERTRLVKSFQLGEQPLFLISLKAGGLGLNLTAADYVIHLDPWWNPAIEDQASDRAHRIGQQRPVTIYKLIAKHTIEEKIIRLHATKKDMADSLLEGSNVAHKLTREELLELLK